MDTYFFGLDFGTGGAKGCIIDLDGKVLSYAFSEYPIINLKPGWSEHDPGLYWKIACQIINQCMEKAKIKPREIKGVAISSALPCMVMVDREGESINNAYNLMDRRATDEVKMVKDLIGEDKMFKITGNRLDDHPSIVNLLWEKSNRPDDYKKIYKALTIEGYIVYKLTGEYTMVHQNATFMGAYNLMEKHFDQEILEEIGLDPGFFPELSFSKDLAGEVNIKASKETGIAAGTPVAAGQCDFNASCIASGIINEGDIQSNIGTCGNFGIIHKDTNFMYEMIAMVFTVGEEDTYITIPTTTTGGMSLRFIRDKFSHLEMAAEQSFGIDAYDILNKQAEVIPPGSEGLIVLPFLTGERTPIWDSHARGVVFGLSLNHNKGHWIRATMEGVAYAMYDSFRLIKESGRKINLPIVMHEGGAKSNLWRQIITDVFNIPTVLTKQRTGAPFGDAYLAGTVTGYFKDFSKCKELAEYIDRMEPDEKNHKRYMEYFSLYKDIYKNLKEDYRELGRIRKL
jgi:sugar (pentulose or hexulose) kinase